MLSQDCGFLFFRFSFNCWFFSYFEPYLFPIFKEYCYKKSIKKLIII